MVTESEQNWEAVVGSQTEAEKQHFFINVCHRVLPKGKATGCPEDAAVCAVGELCPFPRGGWARDLAACSAWAQYKDGKEVASVTQTSVPAR